MSGASNYKVTIRRITELGATMTPGQYGSTNRSMMSEGQIGRNFKVGSTNIIKAGSFGLRRLNNVLISTGTVGSYGAYVITNSPGSPSNTATIRVGRTGSVSIPFIAFGD